MGLIGILIVVAIIYYLKKKKEEKESENEFQIQPDFIETSNQVCADESNPFVEQPSSDEKITEVINQSNPFVDNDSNIIHSDEEEVNYIDLYEFPECYVNDKNFSKSLQNVVGRFSFESKNYVAVSYDWSGQKLLLFQEVINENQNKKYHLVEYGFLWLKLLKVYTKSCSVLPHNLEYYDNVKEMPKVSDEELEDLCECEEEVKSIFGKVEHLTLCYGDGSKKTFWKAGEIEYMNIVYQLLVSHTDTDDISIYEVNGSSYNQVTDTQMQELLTKAFQSKYGI